MFLKKVLSWLAPEEPNQTLVLVRDQPDKSHVIVEHSPVDDFCLTEPAFGDFSLSELIELAERFPEITDTSLYLQAVKSHHPTLEDFLALDKAMALPGDLEGRYDQLAEMLVSFASGIEGLLRVMDELSGKQAVKEIAFRKAFSLLEEDVAAVKKWTEEEREKYFFLLDCLTSHIERESVALEFELKIHYLGVKIEGIEPSPEPCI